MMQNKVLFVDDETNILRGIARMMRPYRDEWMVEVASGGSEALGKLAQDEYDIVVTDMRMPEMSGDVLLSKICQDYPGVIRIILSGHADDQATVKSSGTSHRFLSKPCSAENLIDTLRQAHALGGILQDENLRKLVTGMQSIPTLPEVYNRLIELMDSPDCSMDAVGRVISTDPGLSAKMLQMVNSAYFGLPRSVANLGQATGMLGLTVMRGLVLSNGVFDQLSNPKLKGYNPQALLEYGIRAGRLAKDVFISLGGLPAEGEEVYMAGMLQDIGQMVLASSAPDQYAKAIDESVGEAGLVHTERAEFGSGHAEVGAYLLGLWNLPGAVVECVAFHHQQLPRIPTTPNQISSLLIANLLLDEQAGDSLSVNFLDDLDSNSDSKAITSWRKMRDHDL